MSDDSHVEFVLESREHLQVVERSLLALERAHDAQQVCECVDASLRAIHSLKGNAGFLGFPIVQQLAHATESVLENFRSLPVAPPQIVVETILLANDRLAALVDDLEHSHAQDISGILQKLQAIEIDATPANAASGRTTYQLRISLPTPPGTIVPFFEALLTLGSLSDVQLPAYDLRTSVEHWPQADSPRTCCLQTGHSVIELQQQLSLLGQSVSWLELGAIDLDDFDLTKFDQLSSPTPAPSPQPSPPGILGKREQDLLNPVTCKPGELVYEPLNLLEGVPRQPILWLARAGNAVASDPIGKLLVEDTKTASGHCLPNSLSVPLDVSAIRPEIENSSDLAIPQAPSTTSPTVAPNLAAENSHENREVVSKSLSSKVANLAASEKPNSLRIQVDLLDRLMNLISELTLVRNQSLLAFGESDGAPQAVIQRLNTVTSELQDAVLKTRMQPVENLFGRFPRMVRDLARQLGKQVELILVGQEVELDKTVLEQLSDPLTHLIRNSIDHGLETPDERLKLGKSVVGQVTLSAMAADGQVIIEIRDDGRGIDPEAVR